MAKNFNKYQYETSPRKIAPDYPPKKTPYKPKKSAVKKAEANKKNIRKPKISKKGQAKIVMTFLLGFAVLLLVSYRNAKIDENFAEIQNLKDELSEIDKQNSQLAVAIESSLNLSNVEQQAKELLGMQKLTNKQTIYVTLPKIDYIEPVAEEVIIEENQSFFGSIINVVTNIFK